MATHLEELGQWQKMAMSHDSPRRSTFKSIIFTTFAFLVAFSVLILLIVNVPVSVAKGIDNFCHANQFYRPYVLDRYAEFHDLGPAGDGLWDSLLPENMGFVYRQYTPDGKSEETVRAYGISMFHQLHCLQMIRMAIQSMGENNTTASGSGHHHEHVGEDHWLHCFDYLRQNILCSADDTLEPPMEDPHKAGNDLINGYGQKMCRNNERLYDWSSKSGPSLTARLRGLKEGKTWPEPEGINWPPTKDDTN